MLVQLLSHVVQVESVVEEVLTTTIIVHRRCGRHRMRLVDVQSVTVAGVVAVVAVKERMIVAVGRQEIVGGGQVVRVRR